MIAHIRRSDKARQTIPDHVRQVAGFSRSYANEAGLPSLAYLIALLHDLGKYNHRFEAYLTYQVEHPESPLPNTTAVHTPSGSIFAFEQWHHGNFFQLLTAEIISLCIRAHHGGLVDMLDLDGESSLQKTLSSDKEKILYDESVSNYLEHCASQEELDSLFSQAVEETKAFFSKQTTDGMKPTALFYQMHLLCRLMQSCLVDADRLDSTLFDSNLRPKKPRDTARVWEHGLASLQRRLQSFLPGEPIDQGSAISLIRKDISERCLNAGSGEQGIYTLTVPTGGGKTLSSLGFALQHARKHRLSHIYYIIPFNTILEQNAREIGALFDKGDVLEHHCNVVFEDERAEAYHHQRTERWDVPVILTSVVQFFDALYRHGNTDARRMHQLAHSVIVFDEVQAIPARCFHMLQLTLDFLSRRCKSTVLLCTATQPLVERGPYAPRSPAKEIVGDVSALFEQLERVHIHDETAQPLLLEQAVDKLLALQEEHRSVLVVVNTKKMAADLFNLVKGPLREQRKICVHLSNSLCAAHRFNQLNRMRGLLTPPDGSEPLPLVCITTTLIEAGVDISFPCVVRSFASVPGMVQAAGRCNRHAERLKGHVYLWRLPESLAHLKAIADGQRFSKMVQDQLALGNESLKGRLNSPEAIRWYFKAEALETGRFDYPYRSTDLIQLLSQNQAGMEQWRLHHQGPFPFLLPQAFRTAQTAFRVLDDETKTVVVPYGIEGAGLIAALGKPEAEDKVFRLAQRYAVQVFSWQFAALANLQAVYPLGDSGSYALLPQYYDEDLGLVLTPGEPNPEIY